MPIVYAAYHKNSDEIEKSASGAIFVALSDVAFENNGIVIGAEYNYIKHRLEHRVCYTPAERDLCRGSKYFQSQISDDIYKKIEHFLEDERMVVFTGTPCQVAAITQYLIVKNVKLDNFYSCDILCHGVGSPGIWNSFLHTKTRLSKISYLNFKDKKKGWLHPQCIARCGNKTVSLRDYSWLYFSDAIMRPVCYKCSFAECKRISDFTIGDFWKVKTKCPEMYNPQGTSFVMVNTKKGEKFFEKVKKHIIYKQVGINDVLQNNMLHPTKYPDYKMKITNDYQKMNAKVFFKKWKMKLLIGKILDKYFLRI